MLRPILLLTLAGGAAFAATKTPIFSPAPAPAAANAPAYAEPTAFHCQVPCGIYGDHMRIEMILEDCATIEKGMNSIRAIESGEDENPSINQAVRWVSNKETHAQAIQDQVAQYWLAQRIKAPKDAEGRRPYAMQLVMMHEITVAAMKCKQTTDVAHVNTIRETVRRFAGTYFSEEDLEHLKSHMGEGHEADGHDHDGESGHSHEGGDADHDHDGEDGDGGR